MLPKKIIFLFGVIFILSLAISSSSIDFPNAGLDNKRIVNLGRIQPITNATYGEMTNHSDDTPFTTSLPVQDDWFHLEQFEEGELNNVGFDNNSLIIEQQGVYDIAFYISFGNAGGGANDEYQGALFVDDIELIECQYHRKLGTAGDVGSASGGCIKSFDVGDIINLKTRNRDSTTAIRVFTQTLKVNKLEIEKGSQNVNVNSSLFANFSDFADIWITNEGNLENVDDIDITNLSNINHDGSANAFLKTGVASPTYSWSSYDLFGSNNAWTARNRYDDIQVSEGNVYKFWNGGLLGTTSLDDSNPIGARISKLPGTTTTLAGLAVTQTFTAVNTFSNTINVAQLITHSGDIDTYLEFLTDRFRGFAGNLQWVDAQESTTDHLTFGGNWDELNLTGNEINLNGIVKKNNTCGIPSGVFWAEEAAAIANTTSNGLQYSYGNGNVNAFGIGQPCSGTITAMSISAETANNGNGLVGIVIDGATSTSCNSTTPSAANTAVTTACDLSFTSGQQLTPRTIDTPTGSNSAWVIAWWVRYD
jgi:hypothetical protein